MDSSLVSVMLLAVVSLVVVVPSVRGRPGFGVIGGLVIVVGAVMARGEGLRGLGLAAPADWGGTILLALLLGVVIAVLSQTVIDPLAERLTGHAHDLGPVGSVRGSLKTLVLVVVSVWVLVALVEEVLYRGFLMSEVTRLLGTGPGAVIAALAFSSVVFGLSHWYQGPSGVWSTGVIGALLGLVFVYADFNLWMPILVHGVVDTVLLVFIYLNLDDRLKRLILR